jgi:hypothetical protein
MDIKEYVMPNNICRQQNRTRLFMIFAVAMSGVLFMAAGVLAQRVGSKEDRRKQGWQTLEEVVLPPMVEPRGPAEAEPIGMLEVPEEWSYVPGKGDADSASGEAADDKSEEIPGRSGSRGKAPASKSSAAGKAIARSRIKTIPIARVYGGWTEAVFSTPQPKHAVVYERPTGDKTFPPTALRVFDLALQRQVRKAMLPPGLQPIALSEDGSRVLLQWTWKEVRLYAYDLKANKYIVG